MDCCCFSPPGQPPLPHFVALLRVLRQAAERQWHLLPDGPPPDRSRRAGSARLR